MAKNKILMTGVFRKDLETLIDRGYNTDLLGNVIDLLANGTLLPGKYKDHELSIKYVKCRECQIAPDWILIYELSGDELILYSTQTGIQNKFM